MFSPGRALIALAALVIFTIAGSVVTVVVLLNEQRESPSKSLAQDGPTSRSPSSTVFEASGRSEPELPPEQRAFREGKKELDRQHYRQARAHFDKGLEVSPHDVAARIMNARANWMLADYAGAQKQLDAIKNEPDPDGRIELARQLLTAINDDDWAPWEHKLSKRVDENDPDSEAILEVLAYANLRFQRTLAAVECCDKLLKIRPNHVFAWTWKGQALGSTNDTENAAQCFAEALRLEPDLEFPHYYMALTMLSANRPLDALEHAKFLVEKFPENHEAVLMAARCYRKLGQPEQAMKVVDKGLRLRPQDRRLLVERALVLYQKDRTSEETVKALRQAHKLIPQDREVTYCLIHCLDDRNADRDERAQAAGSIVGGWLGFHASELNTEQAALERQQALSERKFDELRLIEHRIYVEGTINDRLEAARIAEELGVEEQALMWLRSALILAPQDRKVHERLAEYYKNHGDLEKFRHHQAKAMPKP